MLDHLNDKLAVVTGGSRGIGRHIAGALAAAGATVAITARAEARARGAAEALGPRVHPFVCDQRDPAAIESFARDVLDHLGPPDILVNNAACLQGGTVLEMPLDRWNKVIETNLTGVYLMTKAFLPAMIERGRGDIFMISSMSGKKGDPGGSAYAASKFGLQGFSQALNYEVRRHNIRVMVFNPSAVDTGADDGPREGPGLHLHAADLADLVVTLARLPGRTLVRDMDIWGTNPG